MPPRTRNIFDPASREPFKLSRSKLELFMECPRCYYLDRKLGEPRVRSLPFTLNSAVDALLKQEFDALRKEGKPHMLMEEYGIDAIPIDHEYLDKWRHNFTGIQFLHEQTNFLIYGAIDDLWQNSKGEYIVVDYKSTAKKDDVIELNEEWHDKWRRQMEVYQWLLRQNKYKVSDMGYFVHCNGITDAGKFDGKLEFRLQLFEHKGDDSWVEEAVTYAHDCLMDDEIPDAAEDCEWCTYVKGVNSVTNASL